MLASSSSSHDGGFVDERLMVDFNVSVCEIVQGMGGGGVRGGVK